MNNLNELFVLPMGLKKVADMDGVNLYGSDNLNNKIIELLYESDNTKPVAKEIESLIKEKRILPIFSSNGMIKHFAEKLFPFPGKDSGKTLAYFDFRSKKIYLLIDNNINFIGYLNNDLFSATIIHELIHMVSNFKPSYFLSTFKPQLISFYKNFYSSIFKLKKGSKIDLQVEEIYTTLYNQSEVKLKIDFKQLWRKFRPLMEFSELDKNQFKEAFFDYIEIIYLHLKENFSKIFSSKHLLYIVKDVYYVYSEEFGFYPKNDYCIQELLIPSEVICRISQYKPGEKIYSAIKALS